MAESAAVDEDAISMIAQAPAHPNAPGFFWIV
jgi:hypothetical protein